MDISKGKLVYLRILAFAAFIEMAVMSGFGFIEISEFEKLLNELKGTAPFLTNLYLSTYKYWGVLVIFPLFIILQTWQSEIKLENQFGTIAFVLIAHILFGLLIFIGAIFAMYLPIFELGNTQLNT